MSGCHCEKTLKASHAGNGRQGIRLPHRIRHEAEKCH